MPNNIPNMLMYPDEVPTLLRTYDLETISAVGNWGLDMIKRYPCSIAADGSLRGGMAEVCAAIFCMGHYIGQIEAIQKARSRENIALIDPTVLERIESEVMDELFRDMPPEEQKKVLHAGLKAAGFF